MENINESRSPHHNDIQYCYRIGIDVNTGKEVAVQFELIPDNITHVSDDTLINNTKSKMKELKQKFYDDAKKTGNPEWKTVGDMFDDGSQSSQEKALMKIKNSIRKLGHIDFTGNNMKVKKIFVRDGAGLNSVSMVGIMSDVVSETLKSLGYQDTEFEAGYNDKRFAQTFLSKVDKSKAEYYKKDDIALAKDQYLTTRLIWDRELFRKLRYTNAIRPKPVDIRGARGDNPFDMHHFLKNNYVNPYKKSPKLEFFIDPDLDDATDILQIYKEAAFEADNLSHQYRGVGTYSPVDLFIIRFSDYLNEGITQFTYTEKFFENPDCQEIYEELKYFDHFKEPRHRSDLWIENAKSYTIEHCEEEFGISLKEVTNMNDTEIIFEAANEPDVKDPEYNGNMTPAAAKRTLATATASVLQNKKVNQYTADIYANIITKNLLGTWIKGYRKLSITLDPKLKGSVFEFKIPNMTLDFVSRFVDGREPINGFLHRIPEIKIRMSEGAFKTMQNRDDAYNFFRAAVKYYDAGAMKYAEKIANEIMKLPTEMKRLISSTKLSGIVTLPLQMLFSFDDVDMSSTTTFNISKEDISTVNKFIRGIYSQYASPEKEKQKIISDLQNVVYHLKESCDLGENKAAVSAITEGVSNWYSGKYQSQLEKYRAEFEYENVDFEAMKNANHELQMMYESTKMKKLKKIPRDLVAYITIETESIRDANDKMMIASYCLAKLEIVEWYIELLEVGSKKYIVPHSKPYLEGIRRQLLQCYDNIMKVKIVRPNERPLIDIKYPAGYEG